MAMMTIQEGSPTSPLWLIGEALGEEEERTRRPFSGAAGWELEKCLREAGFSRSEFFITNVAHERPPLFYRNGKAVTNFIGQWFSNKTNAKKARIPEVMGRYPTGPIVHGLDHLRTLCAAHNPTLIIACGGTALWALTGLDGITKWRGSELTCAHNHSKLIPTFHSADVLRQYSHRRLMVQDLRRARRESEYPEVRTTPFTRLIPTTPSEVEDWLLPHILSHTPLICDTEGWSCLDCIGFADGPDTICIPLVHLATGESYWSPPDEERVTATFLHALRACPITFHNGLWDCQIISAFYGVMPDFADDTMLMQHVLFPALLGGKIDPVTGQTKKEGSSLSLSFCASIYCPHYRYWKDDGRLWDAEASTEYDFWQYNCEDCFRTWEIKQVLATELARAKLIPQYRFQMELYEPVFDMMAHGLRVDISQLRSDAHYLRTKRQEVQDWLDYIVGEPFNPDSNPQMTSLFYESLHVDKLYHRKTKAVTLNDQALETIARRNPLLAPLCRNIQNWRSLETEENFVKEQAVSPDGRLRFQLSPTGTETMRFSSSTDAFNEGFNAQNLPRPVKDD